MDTSLLNIVLAAVHLEEGPEAVPLGAACVASALKAAFPGKVSAGLVETFVAEGPQVLAARIKAAGPQAVGFSLYTWNRSVVVEAAGILRAGNPELFLFCGGPEAAALSAEPGCSSGDPFDAVIPGEGEFAAADLVGRRFFGTVPVFPSGTGLTGTPSPWLDGTLSARNREGVLWELARGCTFSCAYCYESKGLSEGAVGKNRVRYFPDERLREELRLFVRDGVPYVFVLDPTFNSNNKRALGMLDMIARENSSGIHWHFEIRGELLTREQARRFAALGASLQIGLQTSDPGVSALIGRNLNRGLFASRIGLLNEEGAVFGFDLIYGLPGDSLAGYRRSLDFALSLYPNNLDMFRLAVLPGTALFDRAVEYGLEADPEAPYLVRSAPKFPPEDLDKAASLSQGADLFYNRGRAVAWFNQVLHPLAIRPSAFLEEFAALAGTAGTEKAACPDHASDIEKIQLAYVEARYRKAKKEALVPAVRDLIRFHGAWGRALAEGLSAEIDFTYHPDEILGEAALDLESFAASARPQSVKVRVRPGKEGPMVEWGRSIRDT